MPKRILEGNVVSNKTDKTITVQVERRYMHPVYKKYIRRNDKFAAHDPNNTCQVGDRVRIIESRPISKTKRWVLMDGDVPAVETAKGAAPKKVEKEVKKPAAAEKAEKKAAPTKEKAETKAKAPAKKPAAKKTKDK